MWIFSHLKIKKIQYRLVILHFSKKEAQRITSDYLFNQLLDLVTGLNLF